ncbi:MAG: indole-3-glycerol phosphate synthase TrpC [Rhodospirillaceae bacterium]|nr:indole-3-glycerol phosphate synthase TrpC [Rhodospirillaceae bacterium]
MNRLTPILEVRRDAVAAAKKRVSAADLGTRLPTTSTRRDFGVALRFPGLGVIAEVKRRSPSAGNLAAAADAGLTACRYAEAGAAAISVLTEPNHFGGALEDLDTVREAQTTPVLRKDFIVDPYQIIEARVSGADAILLIVAAVGEALSDYLAHASETGLDALVEVHDSAELEIALDAGASIIGVNNRNLADLGVDLSVSERLLPRIPADTVRVAESGIRRRADAERMAAAGADAILVGTSLMTAEDPATLVAAFRDCSQDLQHEAA